MTTPQFPEQAGATEALATSLSVNVTLADAAGATDGPFTTIPNPKAVTLIDPFSGTRLNTALWSVNGSGTVAVGGGVLSLTDTASHSGYIGIWSGTLYDLTNSQVMVQLVSAGTQHAATQAAFLIQNQAGNYGLQLIVGSGPVLVAQQLIAGNYSQLASVAYNATAMTWLRFRENSGVVFMEYAASAGGPWTTMYSYADPFNMQAMQVIIQQGMYSATDPASTSQWAFMGGPPAAALAVSTIPAASPAFIRSQMPRMHVQNLLTGQWLHRDVQGITSPAVTWALNAPDSFTCNLSPPRPDMMDSTGNFMLREWRDAIYLEEQDTIRFGGIITATSMTGPQVQLTAMGFAGYANGMIYEGPDYNQTKIDALDAVRYMWSWLQSQPGGNIGLNLGSQKSGFLLGNIVAVGITMTLTQAASAGATSIWVGNATGLSIDEQITIAGIPYTITGIMRNTTTYPGYATGQITITPPLGEAHAQGDPIMQISPVMTGLTQAAASNASSVWVGNAQALAGGEVITIGGDQYTINQILSSSTTNLPTGQITLTTNTRRAYGVGTQVIQVRTITPFQLYWYNSTDIGSEMQSIQQEAIFDYKEVHTWTDSTKQAVSHQLTWGIPRIGTSQNNLRFVEGENIIQAAAVTRDGTKYANDIIGLGAGSGSAQIRAQTANLNTGRLRRQYVYTDQTCDTSARISVKANKVLTAMQNIDTVTSIVVMNHPNAPWGSFGPGDDIPVTLATGWRNVTIWSRITQMTQDPTTDLITLTLARSDSFTYMAETGVAGTI